MFSDFKYTSQDDLRGTVHSLGATMSVMLVLMLATSALARETYQRIPGSKCYDCNYAPSGFIKGYKSWAGPVAEVGFQRCSLVKDDEQWSAVSQRPCESGRCFIRKEDNGLVYRGCADMKNLPWLVNVDTNCKYQGPAKSLWWFCEGHLCNGGQIGESEQMCGSPPAPALYSDGSALQTQNDLSTDGSDLQTQDYLPTDGSDLQTQDYLPTDGPPDDSQEEGDTTETPTRVKPNNGANYYGPYHGRYFGYPGYPYLRSGWYAYSMLPYGQSNYMSESKDRRYKDKNRQNKDGSRHYKDESRHFKGENRHYKDESRPFKGENRHYKDESRHFKGENRHYKDESRHFKGENRHYKDESRHYKDEARHYKDDTRHYKDGNRPYKGENRHYKDESRHYKDENRQYEVQDDYSKNTLQDNSSPKPAYDPCHGNCHDNPSGLYADPTRPNNFIQCGCSFSSGKPCTCCKAFYLACPPNLVFDDVKKVCVQ